MVMAGHNASEAVNQGTLLRTYEVLMTSNVVSFKSFPSLDAASLSEGGGEVCVCA